MKNKRSYNLRTMNSGLFSLEEKSTILEKLFDSEDAENIFFLVLWRKTFTRTQG